MSFWSGVSRDELKVAASSAGFDTHFPVLIRRLIAETAIGLTSLDMPGGSGTAVGGFDGVVTATGDSVFVPSGVSVWELSVGGGQTKADQDYEKRLEGPDNLPTDSVTYVEALLVTWSKARDWTADRTGEGRWKEVRGYNLDRIHAWLDTAPATSVWLAGLLGKAPQGARSLGAWWTDTWVPSTRIPLDGSIVLAGREKAADALSSMVASGRSVITLGGDLRPDDVCAFIAATFHSSAAGSISPAAARTLLVSEQATLDQLLAQQQPLILVLTNPALARDVAIQHAHQLLVPATPGTAGDIDVSRLDTLTLRKRLEANGLTHEQASHLGALGRRSLLALRRSLAHHPEFLTPPWATAPDAIRRRLLLLGSWVEENENDRRVVAQCVGADYDQVREKALELSAGTDLPFVANVDGLWHLLSPEDAWTLVRPALNSSDLDALHEVVIEVFSEVDPVLELDEEQYRPVGRQAVKHRFSHSLRRGLAQTLALLGTDGSINSGLRGSTGAQWARRTVHELLARANSDASYRTWNSLTDVVSLLAEAAPDEFVDAMRTGLTGDAPLHRTMFADTADAPFGLGPSSPHSHFLWALEMLAWSPDYFDDAVDVLVRLATVDPGGKLVNRPMASLAGALSAWCPNTSADTDARVRALKRVMRGNPAVGRRLLLTLIPNGNDYQTIHSGPRLRDWKNPTPVSPDDRVRVIDTATQCLLEDADRDPDHYLTLIGKADDISPRNRRELAQRLTVLGATLDNEAQRAALCDALRTIVNKHREYSDAHWALPEGDLDDLHSACEALAPRTALKRHSWLFNSDWITLGDRSRREDYAAYQAHTLERRAAALDEIIDEGGLEAVIDLAKATTYPQFVGVALAHHSDDYSAEAIRWMESDSAPHLDVGFAYISQRLRVGGNELRDELLERTDDALTQARILRASNDPKNRSELSRLDPSVSEHYWREFTYYGLGPESEEVLEVARALLDAGRNAAALDLIAHQITLDGLQDRRTDASEIVAMGMERLLKSEIPDPELKRLSQHSFEQLFALLAEHRGTLGLERVVNLEFQLFPALGFDPDAPTLHQALVEDPALFVELVTMVYNRAAGADDESSDPDQMEHKRAMALRADEILNSTSRCPGVTDTGDVDADTLRAWVLAAREDLATADRATRGDHEIGKLLAWAGSLQAEGKIIPEAVRDLLEEIDSDDLDRGLSLGIYNRRGVTTRALFDGGEQERGLALKFEKEAESARAWPRARKLLRQLAASYESDAERLELEAERRRQGLDR